METLPEEAYRLSEEAKGVELIPARVRAACHGLSLAALHRRLPEMGHQPSDRDWIGAPAGPDAIASSPRPARHGHLVAPGTEEPQFPEDVLYECRRPKEGSDVTT